MQDLMNKRVAVVGLGVSNRPLIDFLISQGACVTGRDRIPREGFGELADTWESRGVRLLLGEGYLCDLDEEIIFRAPGIRPDHPAFLAAVAKGARLTSEMELFFDVCPATVIGVTGSDGKTTSTTLTGLMMDRVCKKRGCGKVYVGGNIGQPLLPLVSQMTKDDFAVVELSSFQLMTLKHSPHRAAITNVTPNHLDWHRDMAEYIAAKTNIYRHEENELLVVNAENATTGELAQNQIAPVTWFSSRCRCPDDFGSLLREGDSAYYLAGGKIMRWDGARETEILSVSEILLPGIHNLENYMTALALTDKWVTPQMAREVAKSFTGVPHRLERVRELDGVIYYNSSIDSSPTRTAAALSALAPKKPIVICGGYDKKIPFEPLAEALTKHAKAVVLTGATAEKIADAIEVFDAPQKPPVYRESDFTRAVHRARELAHSGDVVLLSPACASFDAFKNFAERGETFRKLILDFQ